MKKQKGRVIPSNQEILRRLDKIEHQSIFFNYFAIFIFAFSMGIAVAAIAYDLQSINIFIGALLMFIFAVVVFFIMLLHLFASKAK